MIDAVLSYHTNPATCGVAKFNHLLAQRLGVPCLPLSAWTIYPLISLKFSESSWLAPYLRFNPTDRFALFVHDAPVTDADRLWVVDATAVYAANAVIADKIRAYRPDVITAFCPSTLQGNPHRAALNVLTFGMAHKLQIARYQKLKTLLDGTGQDYTLSVSTAVHEGSPWDAVATVGEQLREIFGDKTRVLGFLADDALARELRECSAVALFFDPALRANNTTYHAAVEVNRPIITNLDEHSPETWDNVYDIETLTKWPDGWYLMSASVTRRYGWDSLLQTMGVTVPV